MKNETRAIVTITDLGSSGEAVFRHEGRVGFVDGLLTGETAEVRLVERGNLWRGKVLKQLSVSPDRINHPCPHASRCPASWYGCMSREAELSQKLITANSILQRIGKIDYEVTEIVGVGPEWGYRNKLELSVVNRSGKIDIGYHPIDDPANVFAITDCLLADEALRQLLTTVIQSSRKALKRIFANATRLLLRSGDGLHLHIVLNEQLANTDLQSIRGFYRDFGNLVGISTEFAKSYGTSARAVVGDLLLPGSNGLATHPHTFRQVNDAVARALAQAAVTWATGSGGTLFDLYGGYGHFARVLCRDEKRELIVFEESTTAIQDGLRALKKKPLPIRYKKCDVSRDLPKLERDIAPSAILLDPPYSGAGPKVVGELLRRKAPKIGYIACHGAALVRDLQALIAGGYKLKQIRLFDMFPRTPEIEWFAELEL